MRIHATSDLHIEYQENRKWLFNLSLSDYRDDMLILAGDISSRTIDIARTFEFLKKCFRTVFFVPGNHDLWLHKKNKGNSLDKFRSLLSLADSYGIIHKVWRERNLVIVPLFSWYDFSFGTPDQMLLDMWRDFKRCSWPDGMDLKQVNEHFMQLNRLPDLDPGDSVISFSHFMPRIDLMPGIVPREKRYIYPALGSTAIDELIRIIKSDLHVYGHSHLNRDKTIDGIRYINCAYAYPHEKRISDKKLKCIYDS